VLSSMRNHDGVWMMKCSNCEASLSFEQNHLLVKKSGGDPCARLCNTCTKDVLTMKIVLKRDKPDEPFTFEGYLPVSSVK
jgi:NAD-dependent SIR2 family protein deacetylase